MFLREIDDSARRFISITKLHWHPTCCSTRQMLTGLYQGSAAMEGLGKWQDAISQNLANSGTAGYKSINVALHSNPTYASGSTDFASTLNAEVVKASTQVNQTHGSFLPSDDPLSCAIEGDGFFEVQTPEGATKYTRDGQFHIDSQNRLVTSDGSPVQGKNGAINATANGGSVSIRANGDVYQNNVQIGQLAVSTVANKDALVAAGGGFTIAPDADAGVAAVSSPTILQGVYEGSNVSAMKEMVNMIIVSRAYEANSKVVNNQDSALAKAIQAFSV